MMDEQRLKSAAVEYTKAKARLVAAIMAAAPSDRTPEQKLEYDSASAAYKFASRELVAGAVGDVGAAQIYDRKGNRIV